MDGRVDGLSWMNGLSWMALMPQCRKRTLQDLSHAERAGECEDCCCSCVREYVSERREDRDGMEFASNRSVKCQ